MFLDAENTPAVLNEKADVCIIGAGPAGIVLALELAQQGREVLLVESGDFGQNKLADSLSDGVAISEKFAPLNMYRRRAVGGASTIWGGRCIPYDPIDFEHRDYVDSKGWPVGYSEIEGEFPKAARYMEIEDAEFVPSRVFGRAYQETIKGFNSADVSGDSIERFSAPTDFGKRYKKDLVEHPRIKLLVHATCTQLELSDNAEAVEVATFKTLSGKQFDVSANTFVVASGGLESYRLLAASNNRIENGIGNGSGLLGLGLMSHIEGNFVDLKLPNKNWPVVWNFERIGKEVYSRRRLVLTAEAQRKHRLMNFIMRFFHATPSNAAHKDGILSLMFLAKRFILPEYRRKMTMLEREEAAQVGSGAAQMYQHFRNIVLNTPDLIKFVPHWIYHRHFQYHRIPYVALKSRTGVHRMEFNSEQSPNPLSKVFLTTDRDRLGMQRIGVDWRMSDQDIQSIAGAIEVYKESMAPSGIELSWGEHDLRDLVREYSAPVGGHFVGTLRMSENPEDGVVDGNLKVHGTQNLFVLSSGVFPTSSHANPTFTLLAFATRLGAHLGTRGGEPHT